MKIAFRLAAVFLFVASAAWAENPPDVDKYINDTAAECRSAGGDPQQVDGFLTRRDLNGDGTDDVIVDLTGLNCVGAESYFCGSAGCPVTVWTSTPTGFVSAWSEYAQGIDFDGSTLVLYLHGQMCDPPRAGVDGCELRVTFDKAGGTNAVQSDGGDTSAATDGLTGAETAAAEPPAAAPAPSTDPAPADAPPPSDRWQLRSGANAPPVAVIGGPGRLRSMAAFCLQGKPWLALLFHDTPASDTVQIDFGFAHGHVSGPAKRYPTTGGTFIIPLAGNELIQHLAGRDSSVIFTADGKAEGSISLAGSTKALRGALAACLKM